MQVSHRTAAWYDQMSVLPIEEEFFLLTQNRYAKVPAARTTNRLVNVRQET